MSVALSHAFLPVSAVAGAAASHVDLGAHFSDPDLIGSVVQVRTSLGVFYVDLTDRYTPKTVANFLKYVNAGRYNNTIVHRSAPGFVIQAGGYTPNGKHVPQDAPVANEPYFSNTRGTLAMAKLGGNPNSATSEWFVNLADNSANLDAQNGGFTVFGGVMYDGMKVVDAIAKLKTVNDSALNGAFTDLPVRNYAGGAVGGNNFVAITSVARVQPLAYKVSSDNPSLVSASVSKGVLTLGYGAGKMGTAHVTVTATDLAGKTASGTFAVKISAPPKGVISGVVYRDANGDGKQQSTKAALSGWRVYLDANSDGKWEGGEASMLSDSKGRYSFTLSAGSYRVREVLKSGYRQVAPKAGYYSIKLAAGGAVTGQNFGNK